MTNEIVNRNAWWESLSYEVRTLMLEHIYKHCEIVSIGSVNEAYIRFGKTIK